MKNFIKFVSKITSGAQYIVAVIIVALMLLTVADVVLRLVANTTISGVTEYSQMLMAIILLAAGATGMEERHITVDIAVTKLSPKLQNIFVIITSGLSAVISGFIALSSYQEVLRSYEQNFTYMTLGFAKWPFYLIYAIALTLLCLAAVTLVVKYIGVLLKGGKEETHE